MQNRLTQADAARIRALQGRNWATLAALLGLAALFYAVTVARIGARIGGG